MSSKAQEVVRRNAFFTSTRTGALYKDFKAAKELNPEGYEANIEAWKSLIHELLLKDSLNDKLSIPPAPELARLLTHHIYGQPLSMDLIIDELVQARVLIPVSVFHGVDDIFQYADPKYSIFSYFTPAYWLRRGTSILHAVRAVFAPTERCVEYKNLTSFGDAVVKHIKAGIVTHSSALYNEDHFRRSLRDITPIFSASDMDILLTFLSRDKKACVVKSHDGTRIIKFTDDMSDKVTDEDVGVAKLRWQSIQVDERLEWLQNKIDALTQQLKVVVKEGTKQKSAALSMLKTRKIYERSLHSCTASQQQLTEVLSRIDDATSNAVVFNALKDSSKILEELNKKIDVDELDNLKFDLATSMQQTDEISDMLGEGSAVDDDVEEEFNRMAKEESAKNARNANSKKEEIDKKLLDKLENLNISKNAPVSGKKTESKHKASAEKKTAILES